MKLILLTLLAAAALAQTTNYPGGIDNNSTLFVTADNIQTTLNAAMQPADTTAVVRSAARFVPNMIATVCDTVSGSQCTVWEHMLVTAVSGNVLTVTRGFAGTTANTHASGKTMAILIDSAHQKVLKDAVIAIETALGPNLANVAGGSAATPSSGYVYTPQSCNSSSQCVTGGASGMSLVSGNNSVTMQPVPAGLNGTDSGHSIYVSGGTGAPEACPITGGSGTAGSPSGQIIISCAHSHTGAWTIQSATCGIQEGIQSITSTGGVVQAPAGVCLLHGNIVLPSNITLKGSGKGMTTLRVASGEWNNGPGWTGALLGVYAISTPISATHVGLSDLTLDGNYTTQSANPGSGAVDFVSTTYSEISRIAVINFRDQGAVLGLYSQTATPASQFNVVQDSEFHGVAASLTSGQIAAEICSGGIFVQGQQNVIRRNYMDGMCDDGYIANANFTTETLFEGNIFYGQVNHQGQAYHNEMASGTRFIGNYCNGGGVTSVCFHTTCPTCAANTVVQGPLINSNYAENYALACATVGDTNATYIGSVINGNYCNGTASGATGGIDLAGGTKSTAITGNYVFAGGPSSGSVGIQAVSNFGANSNLTITGNTIRQASTAGIYIFSPANLVPGADPLTITGNSIIDDRATPIMQYGIFVSNKPPASITVVGNTIKGSTTKDIASNAAFTGAYNFEGNVTDGLFNQLKLTSGVTFANLPPNIGIGQLNGATTYCIDCVIAATCAAGGGGAMAKRLNNAWVCN